MSSTFNDNLLITSWVSNHFRSIIHWHVLATTLYRLVQATAHYRRLRPLIRSFIDIQNIHKLFLEGHKYF